MKKLFNKSKGVIMALGIGLMMNTAVFSQSESGELMKRSEIDPKYTWNLEDIYQSPEKWEEEFKLVESRIEEYEKYEGTLGSSAESLLACFKFDDEMGIKLGSLYLYASLAQDLDLGNAENQGRYNRLIAMYTKVGAASSFISPEVLAIPEDKLWSYINSNAELKVYEQSIKDLLRTKEHTLSKEQEEILALASPVNSLAGDVFSMFNNADIQFPKVEGEDGKEIQVSHGRYGAAMYSNDRSFRERVYKGIYKPYKEYQNTYGALFNGQIKSLIFNARARKYNSTREASLDRNNIPLSVYDNLVKTVKGNIKVLHRWAELKKKVLGYKELHPYDTYVSLFPSVKREYSYDEASEILYKSLMPLGEQYVKDVKNAVDNRWIDVYETKGKRSGAYSSGTTFGVHPYVLLNWNNQLNDVFTFTHEMGHNMHSYYTANSQPYPYANYSIFVAEVASITNEALLLDYLIKNAKSKEEKLALIEMNLQNIQATFFRQTRFADFEQLTNELTEKGEALTPVKLTELFGDMYKEYWGPAMSMDEEEGYSWARIPHFYYNFYVYQYATSYAASQAVAEKILTEGEPAVKKYLEFLSAGSSDYPIEVLKKAGVDMNSPEVVKAVVRNMNKLMDQMEELLNEK